MPPLRENSATDDLEMSHSPAAAEHEESAFDDEPFDHEEAMSESEAEKDETELELERLVFGDTVGFREEVKGFKRDARDVEEDAAKESGEEEGNNALTTVDSADLFFLDSGPAELQDGTLLPSGVHEDDDLALRRGPPAWADSDDERLTVSLMAVPRLRKLRHFEGEDVISGKEYSRRLRKQFEILNPRPEWAKWTPQRKTSKKRRRGSNVASASSEDANSSTEDSDANEEDFTTKPLAKLLRSSEVLTRSLQSLPNKRVKLRPEAISIERMKDIGPTQPSAITSLSIHPTLPLILSSGLSSTLYLHNLEPHPTPPDSPNPLITSLHLKHTPLTTTAFSPPTTNPSADPKIYLSSRRRYFHIWDLPTGQIRKVTRVYGHQDSQRSMETLKPSPCGRYVALLGTTRKASGVVNVLDATTLQWTAQVRVESRNGLADFAWWSDGRGLCLVGRGGEVTEWSAEQRRVVARWQDEGAVGTTTLALGGRVAGAAVRPLGPDRWVAVGSASGIINIYERGAWTDAEALRVQAGPPRAPAKTLDNLTTPVSQLVFSPCGQLLAVASRWKRDALRLVHLPSCAVYRNWPTGKTPLGRVSAVALGECEDGVAGRGRKVLVLCVGNEAGVLRAWEIRG